MSEIGAVIGRIQSIQSQISQIESLAQSGFAELLASELTGSLAGSAAPGGLAPADAASVATLERSLSVGAGTRTEGFVRPVPGPVTSDYGLRTHPISGSHSHHDGIDFGAPMGSPIKAASGGTVSFVGWINGYGNVVIVDHGAGMQTFYAHQSRTLASKGDRVSAGEVIGQVGSTGNSTGPHLHFEVRRNGEAIDPAPYLNGQRQL